MHPADEIKGQFVAVYDVGLYDHVREGDDYVKKVIRFWSTRQCTPAVKILATPMTETAMRSYSCVQ